MAQLHGFSITYRIALDRSGGRMALLLQTVAARSEGGMAASRWGRVGL